MAVPTYRMRQIANDTTTAELDTAAERIGVISDATTVNMGSPPSGGSPLDFGTVDISGGADSSDVGTGIWDITADGGNTTAEGFKLWLLAADNGFDSSTVVDYEALSGADQGSPSSTENYIANADSDSYTGNTNIPATEPSQNLWPSDEGTSMTLSTTSDDGVMFAIWIDVASDETTGTYEGTGTSGYELRFSWEFSYS